MDGQAETGHRAKRSTQLRAHGPLHEFDKDIVNIAEKFRSCTRYGRNAKFFIPKKPGQELQLEYVGPLEDNKGNKIYLLIAIDGYSKFPSLKITKSTGDKSSVKFLLTYIETHGIPESIRTDQFCTGHNIEQKFCPVGDHRGCGLVERAIQACSEHNNSGY